MPELPEVETTTRGLRKCLPGLVVRDVWSDYHKKTAHGHKQHIKNRKYFDNFKKQIVGKKIKDIGRRGKNILILLENGVSILTHMKMTGHYLYGDYSYEKKDDRWVTRDKGYLSDPYNSFIHLIFKLSNNKFLALSDVRKFAKVIILDADVKNHPDISILGPDPLTKNFSFKMFKDRILLGRGPTKSVLMNQKIISGIGNIYSDEILSRSCVHPESVTKNIPDQILKKTFTEMKKILREAIKVGGDSTSDYRKITGEKGGFQKHHKVYRRKGEKCLYKGCRGVVERKVIRGRSAHFCNKHQKKY